MKLNDSIMLQIYSAAAKMGKKYENSNNDWAAGNRDATFVPLLNQTVPKHIMTFIPGLMGEFCVYETMIEYGYSDFPLPDLTVYTKGTNCVDFNYNGVDIQVKCGELLVRTDKVGADIFIFCSNNLLHNEATILGWISKEDLIQLPPQLGKKHWMNYCPGIYKLRPLSDLFPPK